VKFQNPIRRRRIFAITLAWPIISLGSYFTRFCLFDGLTDGATVPHHMLTSLLEDPCKAQAIGTAYLKTLQPDECSPVSLARSIGVFDAIDVDSPGMVRTLRQRVRRDFAESAVVNVDGWVLSITEARLYALAALTAGGVRV
jgi:hypothetical protein